MASYSSEQVAKPREGVESVVASFPTPVSCPVLIGTFGSLPVPLSLKQIFTNDFSSIFDLLDQTQPIL
jgi:hypothetical protein